MNKYRAILLSCFVMVLSISYAVPSNILNKTYPDGKPHTFSFGGKDGESFLLDKKPFQIRSGEMHPQRIPKIHWRNRIQMAKAMGMNTIAFYVMWNDFEQPDGSFDFKSGNRDIATFMRICQEEGMWVLFRPGPYVCGEWDFGGLPAYLLKEPKIKLRTTSDVRFMAAQEKYLTAIAPIAKPFLVQNGGPILMTQLENEYGSYPRKSRSYMQWLKDFWTKQGFGPFYSSDGAGKKYLEKVVLPGVAVGLDPGKSEKAWDIARTYNPGVPIFSSETYPGWLRHWGEGDWRPTNLRKAISWYMETGKSFNIFVIHGGSNFGFTAGANGGGRRYYPDVTSYDYGSPINEQGHPTKEYFQYRKIIEAALKANGPLPEVPKSVPAMEIPPFSLKRLAGLWELFPKPKPVPSDRMWFESWGQNQGLAFYRTTLPAGDEAELYCSNIHDYGLIFLDGKFLKKISRRRGKRALVTIPKRSKPAVLEILVEGMGHINFSGGMESDRKGLFGVIKLGKKRITDWQVAPLPLRTPPSLKQRKQSIALGSRLGSYFRGVVVLKTVPQDTFFDMSKYTKGMIWVNGHNLGRYWNVGAQQRLYCPASWLRKGENIIDILDLHMTKPQQIRGCKTRNYLKKGKKTKNADNVW